MALFFYFPLAQFLTFTSLCLNFECACICMEVIIPSGCSSKESNVIPMLFHLDWKLELDSSPPLNDIGLHFAFHGPYLPGKGEELEWSEHFSYQ